MTALAIIFLAIFGLTTLIVSNSGPRSDEARAWRGLTNLVGVALAIVVLAS